MSDRYISPYRYPVHTIRKRRIAKGLSQMKLAAALHVDIQAVQHWETGKRYPNRYNELALDDLLGPPEQEKPQ